VVITPAPPTASKPHSEPYDPWKGVVGVEEDSPVNRIEMKALTYQSVPLGNDKAYVDKDGKFFVFSEEEAAARISRRLAERLSPEPEPAAEEATEETQSESDDKPWLMQMEPQDYLQKYGPDAKNSAQARAEIARRGDKAPAQE
jgi:hypothetical protein